MAEKRIEPGPLATQVARSIQRIREKQRVTYAELAERLAAAGRPIPVLGLSRMEKGDRRVDLDDLVAIARALRVPPIWLLFPLGQAGEPDIDLLPGVRIPVDAALAWFTGDGEEFHDYFGHGGRDPDSGLYEWYEIPEGIDTKWTEDVRPLWLYRQHRRYVLDWFETFSRPRMAAAEGKPVGEFVFTLAALAEENLRTVRNEMRRLGLPLPRLPEGGLRDRFEPKGGDGGGQED
ncbi:helix-turn-helix domain-containing protein [Dactylosporangium sp. NBC_01737]|uniref:helix-turn-helix domain-containing protein n=1 Tax=Dactylosporangium sp. NBC_01737 TaxID=2975959 RepID=UPI002E13D3BF|nr:helix-turn-helix domain-containing protein [Dactylosporangium sp. NBC_01737]